jgi:hypothetical protein
MLRTSAINRRFTHEANWILRVSSDLAVDEDFVALLVEDLDRLLVVQRVGKLSLKDDVKRHAVSDLVWALAWSGGENTAHLVHHPSLWCSDSLKVLLRSSCHVRISFFSFNYPVLSLLNNPLC